MSSPPRASSAFFRNVVDAETGEILILTTCVDESSHDSDEEESKDYGDHGDHGGTWDELSSKFTQEPYSGADGEVEDADQTVLTEKTETTATIDESKVEIENEKSCTSVRQMTLLEESEEIQKQANRRRRLDIAPGTSLDLPPVSKNLAQKPAASGIVPTIPRNHNEHYSRYWSKQRRLDEQPDGEHLLDLGSRMPQMEGLMREGFTWQEAMEAVFNADDLKRTRAAYNNHHALLLEEEMVFEMKRQAEIRQFRHPTTIKNMTSRHDRDRNKLRDRFSRTDEEARAVLAYKLSQAGLLR